MCDKMAVCEEAGRRYRDTCLLLCEKGEKREHMKKFYAWYQKHSAVPMILSVIGTVGTRIVWIFGIFPQHRSLYVLFISYPGSWIITIIMQVICYLIVRKKVHSRTAAV